MSSLPIQVPYRDILIELQDQLRMGFATKRMQDWMLAVTTALPTYQPLVVTDFGAGGNGTRDDTPALQKAVNQAAANGGGTIIIPPGTYAIGSVQTPTGDTPITLLGAGSATILKRRADLADGAGLLDILGSNVTLDSLVIDGDVTTPAGLLYNGGFTGSVPNDPMASSLTKNTSVWLHGPARNFLAQRVTWQHSGGYAVLIDATSGGISDVRLLDCLLQNCRPHLFGITAGQELYGSWTGGIHVQGDGRLANAGRVLRSFAVERCRFLRMTGNALWSHSYGLDELHEDFRFFANYFLDVGLDGIEVGAVTGGAVSGNVFRRIGYVTMTDSDQSVPRWLQNLNATALDSSGLVKGVPYEGNSFLSVNGGNLDLDSHGYSVIAGNVCRIPYPGESEYDEDQIAISGPMNNGSYSYGVNLSNSSNTPWGAVNITLAGNSFINLRAGAARLFAARRCTFTANDIIASDNSVYPPVGLGPIGPGPNQRCYENRVAHNKIHYAPAAAAPAVIEDETMGAFTAAEANSVFGNCPIGGNGLATEFHPSPNSGSVHYTEQVWFV